MERIYLDNNATTIVDPKITDAMFPFFSEMYGNPNSLHSFGTEVHPYMKLAFDRIYAGIGAGDEDDVIINSCASEGNNHVLKGVYHSLIRGGSKSEIITTSVEHPCVMEAGRFLEDLGVKVHYLPVNEKGIVDVETLDPYLDPEKTALVSIMWANNETGLLFPIKELAAYCRERGVLFHSDAAQVIGKVPVNLQEVPVDFLTFSGHKFHAPKGIGGLFIRSGALEILKKAAEAAGGEHALTPLLHGGHQMGGHRAGTVNVPYLIGMGLAMELAVDNLPYEATEVRRLRDRLEDGIADIEGIFILGDRDARTPNTILASIRGVEGEALIWDLNRKGIAASTGSACASETLEANPTFVAMGLGSELAHTGIRLSLSRFTTEEEIDYSIQAFRESVERLRHISTAG
jgi:cysteine desulfurase